MPIDAWGGRIQEQCVKMVDHSPLSEQQVAQLMRSLILVEQVRILPVLPDRCAIFFHSHAKCYQSLIVKDHMML